MSRSAFIHWVCTQLCSAKAEARSGSWTGSETRGRTCAIPPRTRQITICNLGRQGVPRVIHSESLSYDPKDEPATDKV